MNGTLLFCLFGFFGLKFCPTPLDVNWAVFDNDLQEFFRRLRLKEFFHDARSDSEQSPFRNKSSWCPPTNRVFYVEEFIHKIEEEVRNFQPKRVKDNLTPEEREALKALCNDSRLSLNRKTKDHHWFFRISIVTLLRHVRNWTTTMCTSG